MTQARRHVAGGQDRSTRTQGTKKVSKVLKTLAESHPEKIDSIERDETGWIINLTDDYVECSDPLRPSHMIFEDTVAECVSAFRSIRKAKKGE
jgi:hypothetical protein